MSRAAPALMVQGTTSGAGKSFLVTALCRIYARRGVRVVPFKAQNMSNNAAVTAEGGEVGRAQALQARAAGVPPDVRMNPVLLKPLADTRADVVVLGRSEPGLARVPWHERKPRLWPVVAEALDALRRDAELVVIEGAGSPAETNLRHSDIVNMAVARHADAAVLLAADIDRGGAFAALYGTWALLEEADRRLIRGFILNRFRGDAALLAPAPDHLRLRTGIPTVGLVPHTRHRLPEEDAMGLASAGSGPLTIAAVRLPYLSNFDDLDPLAAEPGVQVRWVDRPDALAEARAIVLPGTRNTIGDLRWLWESGLAAAIRTRAGDGVPVIGLCGGFQMLGRWVRDPDGVEAGGECAGLGLLDVETVLGREKVTRAVRARVVAGRERVAAGQARGGVGQARLGVGRAKFVAGRAPEWGMRGMAGVLAGMGMEGIGGMRVEGYEIHHGRTVVGGGARVWLEVEGEAVGVVAVPGGVEAGSSAPRARIRAPVWGTYLHGLFHNDALRRAWLASLHAEADAGRAGGAEGAGGSWEARVERELDRVADVVEGALDMGFIDGLVGR